MRRRIFKLSIFHSIGFVVLLLAMSASAYGQKASATQGKGEPRKSEPDIDYLIEKFEKEGGSKLKAAEAYLKRGIKHFSDLMYEQAMADYNRAISLNPKFEDAYYARGYLYIENRLFGSAIREFNRVKEINPKNADADTSLTWIYSEIRRGKLSIEEYDDLIQLEPTNAEYYYYRSQLHYKAKNFIKAVEDQSKAIEINPEYAKAYIARAISYCDAGKRKESIADIEKHDQLSGIKTLGTCLLDIKQCPEKDDDCLMALYTEGINKPKEIGRQPQNSLGNYYSGRGVIYYERGDYERAFSDFEKGFIGVQDKRVGVYYGKLLFLRGKYDEALKVFGVALPEAEASLGIGEVYLVKREFEKALENYDKAIFLNPRLSNAYLGRGTVYLERGKNYDEFDNNQEKSVEAYRSAIKNFDSAIELDLKEINPEVYLRRSKALEKLGENEKAAADRKKYEEFAAKLN